MSADEAFFEVPAPAPSSKKARLEQMFGDPRYSDCVVRVGSGNEEEETLPANKVLLARCSEVFGKMLFEQPMHEFSQGEIRIQDCSASAVRQLLRCSHDLPPEICEENFVEVFQLARKYEVEELLQASREWMAIAMSSPVAAMRALDAVGIYSGSEVEDELAEVMEACLRIVTCHGDALLFDDAFLDCSETTMLKLLQQECFRCDEERLWLSLLRWAERRPGDRSLFNIVPYVRFNVMSSEFFVDRVVPTGALEDKQVVELLCARVTRRSAVHFSDADLPRCGIVGAFWDASKAVQESFECSNQGCTVARNNYPHWKRVLGRWNCDDKMHKSLGARAIATFSVRVESLITQKGRYAGDVHIGVAQPSIPSDDHSETRNTSVPAWVYCCSDGRLLGPNQQVQRQFVPLGDGDVLRFDLRGQKLYLYLNDQHLGLAFDDIVGPVVPVVEMNLSGSAVTLC